ncbi:MAG: hypothetical protein AVDCRST_MAG88-4089 [uncultured Thermomicrobiales bacterium]|uniref:Lipoprotein n=1 Tax=uncultured Thermomicrobiales bacterium TaxID=1645740 RepID=A0A6J4VSK1_9BACT|nr:MAG: hypothetical protein AVDCRST_MAG88-4089 [uncultured Thermomicrobiales bacterium]
MATDTPRRMRSSAIRIGLVGALAVSLSACGGSRGGAQTVGGDFAGPDEPRSCVDADTEELVPEENCLVPMASPTAGGTGTTGTRPRRYGYRYGGRVDNGRLIGGSTSPSRSSSSSSRPSGGVETGGFGADGGKSGTGGGKSGGSSSSGSSGGS